MKYLLTITLIVFSTLLFSQMELPHEKAVSVFESGDMEKGVNMMRKVVEKNPNQQNWEILVNMYYARFLKTSENKTKAIADAIMEGLVTRKKKIVVVASIDYFIDLMNVCREISLYYQSERASQLLRTFLVDSRPDTAITENAEEEFKKAEKFFSKKDFNNCKIHYLKAIEYQPDYYSATIYLGDSYWYLKQMDSAIYYFKKGIAMQPNMLEPRKYLVDALNYNKQYKEAKKECLDALYIYPDVGMLMRLVDLYYEEGKSFQKRWIKRGCTVNSVDSKTQKVKDKFWKIYKNAQDEIKIYCDSNGIITKPNTLTKSKYMEVYSWEKMLNSKKELPEEFAFAKKMQDAGYLDCYVLFSLFHYDLYPQYTEFVKDNKERIFIYIETFLT